MRSTIRALFEYLKFAVALISSSRSSPLARKIPFEDPIVLGYVRIAYITAQVVILATYYYVTTKLSSNKLRPLPQWCATNTSIMLASIAPPISGTCSPLLPSFQDGWNANNPKQLRSHSVEATASGYQCWTPFERNPGPLTPHPLVDSPILGQDLTVTAVLQAIITFFIFPPSHTLRSSLPRA
ncbi:hypothetical protein Agabi119p4_3290 [Agaricus bisporus var. burnettii]|uniref:Uncharacterized protein n=1 Tax=Agaricus bisporus var. burnettii TaxID=192524 RepID=A0A8H7F6X7_AGABI|nr:hypothetical protein Agabi119p4_3290 [Agaricus bisporus var. burnettii]